MLNRVTLATTRSRLISSGLNSRKELASLLKTNLSLEKLSSSTGFGERVFSTTTPPSALDAFKLSCYRGIDYTISEDATVYEAVQKFSAFDVGALVTVDSSASSGHINYCAQGVMSGIVSERDYICKIALLGRTSKETKVKEISTKSGNLLTAKPTDSIENCMDKILSRGIRHIPIVDDENGACVGFLSVKDLLKEVIKQKESQLERLASFALGKF